jgi:hypothetical protein
VARNLTYAIAAALAMWILSATELTYINGNVAAIIMASGAITALAFSALQRRGGVMAQDQDRSGPELVAAAQRYLLSLNEEQLLELEGFGMKGKVRGRRLFSDHGAILLLFFMFSAFMYYHHTTTLELLAKNLEATTENTYVSTLTQAERERLNLSMPESLRRKMRTREP